ncbi:MAG: hypothetical protein IPO66_17940, partial [Rhodanobacteraceae bacterium]|nr:hypothetical protein [Rhodanobacteraceae bacterium]
GRRQRQRSIDPAQADVPGEWREFPAFAMASKALTLAERSRGLGDDANRLSLQRELWLDFNGNGYTIQDRIYGRMRQGFRLDLAEPYTLLSASERGEPLLVTAGQRRRARYRSALPPANVEASARLPWTSTLPAHGWSERLDGLSTALHLPPGYRLLYAGGADRAPQAWLERWDIYAVFIAAFAVVLAWRLGGWSLAGVVALLVVLGVHEPDAPRYSLIALLLLLLGWRALNAGRLRQALALGSLVAALGFAWVALPFAIAQARYALHPQLADGAVSSNWVMAAFDLAVCRRQDGAAGADGDGCRTRRWRHRPHRRAWPEQGRHEPHAAADDGGQVEVTGSRIKRAENLERYAKDAVVQAGVGRPNWRWMQADLGFDGPVDREQMLDLWLSPPWLTALWRLLLVAALAAFALLLPRRVHTPRLRRRRRRRSAGAARWRVPLARRPAGHRIAAGAERAPDGAAALCAAMRAAGGSGAQHRRRTLDADAGRACRRARAGAAAARRQCAGAGRGARRQRAGAGARHRAAGAGWVAVERGVHRLTLAARIRGDRVALDFPLAPARVLVSAAGWTAAGLRDGRLLAERLELVREAPSARGAETTRRRGCR